jgi:hypothetical protein
MVCIVDIQSVITIWDEPIEKACDHEQKKILRSYLPNSLLTLITCTHLPIISLPTYQPKPITYTHIPIGNLPT